MKPYNIDRAKELNDQWEAVKLAKLRLGYDCLLIVKHCNGDVMVNLTDVQARSALDARELDLKKRLTVTGIEVDLPSD